MRSLHMLVCAGIVLALSGCDGGEPTVYEEYQGPELHGFYMTDSFYVNSEFDHQTDLELDPDEYDGAFEVSWDVHSHYDYTVLIGVNDRPSMRGATIIGSDLCGAGLSCDDRGDYVCRYTHDFYLGCGQVPDEAEANLAPVDHFFSEIPQLVYFNLEVCDASGAGCELSSIPVWLY